MTIYSKKEWKDHIVDSSGKVVQQGTPLSAENMNRIEDGLANATTFMAGELGAATAHSGVLQHIAAISPAFIGIAAEHIPGQVYVPNPTHQLNNTSFPGSINGLRMGPIDALIAGNRLQVVNYGGLALGVLFYLPDPPTEGTRDDFVFLEAWRDPATQEWKTRIRVVAGVDFLYALEGFAYPITTAKGAIAQAQGANTQPLENPLSDFSTSAIHMYSGFYPSSIRATTVQAGKKIALDDVGVYIAGNGTEASKAALKTYDGYVYAIPLFKVNRRNTGSYSVHNPNGAITYKAVGILTDAEGIAPQATKTVTLSSGYTMGEIKAGDRLVDSFGNLYFEVVAVLSSTSLSVKNLRSVTVTGSISPLCLSTLRPDNLYANVIDERDITDLRHKTYLVAPSYEQLLLDGTDQILRGASQVERKKAMRKTYVGVRKTPLDANHLFYASFDGTVTAEIGGPTGIKAVYAPSATGAGKVMQEADKLVTTVSGSKVTVEAFFRTSELFRVIGGTNPRTIFKMIYDTGTLANFNLAKHPTLANAFYVLGSVVTVTTPNTGFTHLRLTYNADTHLLSFYINGTLAASYAAPSTINNIAEVWAGEIVNWGYLGVMSDFAVSNIDRGTTFATLPADFIAGYADITAALSDQRRINSDSQTSQKSYAAAKVKNQPQERCITVTKGTGTNTAAWEAGDKIKVRGIAGEVISGVIDSDTALATIRPNPNGANYAGSPVTVYVDDVSKLSVGDKFTAPSIGNAVQTISAIDTTAKTVTFDNSSAWVISNAITPATIYETTASTSSPVVRAIISGTSTTVPGTWTALGTNEAEVTLGSLPGGLAAQDIIIEYSLNMPSGQGSLYQVYTKTLGGEANGKKLIETTAAASPMLVDDFTGKIAGSLTVNPNRAYSYTGATPAAITALGTEFSQAEYDAIKNSDNTLKTVTTTVNGEKAQVNLVFDVIKAFEQKYGVIAGCYTVSEKVAWLRANMRVNFTPSALGYGVGPAGASGAQITVWTDTTFWGFQNYHGSIAPQPLQSVATSSRAIHTDGFVYVNVMASNASDGVTASTLYIDTAAITFYPLARTGYDILVPENARRDAGLGGLLYIRKQTREVESLFPGNDEDNGISVIGEYMPTQEMTAIQATLSGTTDLLLGIQNFITTAGTNRAYGTNNLYANAITTLLGPGDDLNYKVDPQTLVSAAPYESSNISGVLRYWYADFPHGLGVGTSMYGAGIPSWATVAAEFLSGSPRLVLLNGEILLMLKLRKRSTMATEGLGGGSNNYYYRLQGRPLIKL
jgi:VCBS repeat-containing protein